MDEETLVEEQGLDFLLDDDTKIPVEAKPEEKEPDPLDGLTREERLEAAELLTLRKYGLLQSSQSAPAPEGKKEEDEEDEYWHHDPKKVQERISKEADRIASVKHDQTMGLVRPMLESTILSNTNCPDEAKPFLAEAVKRLPIEQLSQPGVSDNLTSWAIGEAVKKGAFKPGATRQGSEPTGSSAGPIDMDRVRTLAAEFERQFGYKPDRTDLEALGAL